MSALLTNVTRRMRARPMRTALTLLQLILGAFAMTVALSAMLRAQIGGPIGTGAAERFDVVARQEMESGGYSMYPLFATGALEQILELAPDVERVALSSLTGPQSRVAYQGGVYEFRRTASVSPGYFEMAGMTATRGSFFTSADEVAQNPVLVISDDAAAILFGDVDPIGMEIESAPPAMSAAPPGMSLPTTEFRVVATFEAPEAEGFQAFSIPTAYFPLWSTGSPFASQGAMTLNVLARAGRGEQAREQVVVAARTALSAEIDRYGLQPSVVRVLEEGDQPGMSAVVNPTAVILAIFGLVAVIVGAIGNFSITVVDVIERSHELGVRRALGASGRRLMGELTLEAAAQAALGALVGVGLAWLLMPVMAPALGSGLLFTGGFSVQPVIALLVVVLTVVLGGLLALVPAAQMGRRKPIAALHNV